MSEQELSKCKVLVAIGLEGMILGNDNASLTFKRNKNGLLSMKNEVIKNKNMITNETPPMNEIMRVVHKHGSTWGKRLHMSERRIEELKNHVTDLEEEENESLYSLSLN